MGTDQREPVVGDAFGTILTRCWEAGAVAGAAFEVVERDDGYVGAGDAARYFAGADSWSSIERWAREQVTGRALDVGCGAGRHALPLQGAGHEVVGLDASPGAVAVAAQRGVAAVVGSIEQIPPELGLFDTVLLLGNNLGLLANAEHAAVVLGNLAAVMRPGGRLLGSGSIRTGLAPRRTWPITTGTDSEAGCQDRCACAAATGLSRPLVRLPLRIACRTPQDHGRHVVAAA